MPRKTTLGGCFALLAFAACRTEPLLAERWVYFPFRLSEEKNIDKLRSTASRAAAAGYSAIVLDDPDFGRIPLMGPDYPGRMRLAREIIEEAGLRIVPALFPIGHSENLLRQNPNLAEGLPVREALYVVHGGRGQLVPDPPVAFGSTWERRGGDWKIRDPSGVPARIAQTISVHPFRQYHISVRIRTRDFLGTPRIVATGRGRQLNYDLPGVRPTQDWTRHHAVFNSLDSPRVTVSIGAWDGTTGELELADPRIEEVGLLNVLNRPGAPLSARTEEGRSVAVRAADERLARFEEWHEPPQLLAEAPDGTKLRVSYYHCLTFPDNHQMMICPSEPETLRILRDQAERLHQAFHARAYLMSQDEIRVLNWDESCRRRRLTPGRIVAENARELIGILRALSPGVRIFTWSDMWDPYHNAHDHYCLVEGDLAGSWEGLDTDVTIADWYFDRRDESLAWFAGRGHKLLLAGYYDREPERAREWMASARKVPGVVGIMYTSWFDKFDDLEIFLRNARDALHR